MSSAPREQKRKDAYPAVIELRAFLDAQFNSPMFGTVLSMARMQDKSIPERTAWLRGWEQVKGKMADGKYVAAICDELPPLLARYTASNGMRIFGDPVLRQLVRRGLQ